MFKDWDTEEVVKKKLVENEKTIEAYQKELKKEELRLKNEKTKEALANLYSEQERANEEVSRETEKSTEKIESFKQNLLDKREERQKAAEARAAKREADYQKQIAKAKNDGNSKIGIGLKEKEEQSEKLRKMNRDCVKEKRKNKEMELTGVENAIEAEKLQAHIDEEKKRKHQEKIIELGRELANVHKKKEKKLKKLAEKSRVKTLELTDKLGALAIDNSMLRTDLMKAHSADQKSDEIQKKYAQTIVSFGRFKSTYSGFSPSISANIDLMGHGMKLDSTIPNFRIVSQKLSNFADGLQHLPDISEEMSALRADVVERTEMLRQEISEIPKEIEVYEKLYKAHFKKEKSRKSKSNKTSFDSSLEDIADNPKEQKVEQEKFEFDTTNIKKAFDSIQELIASINLSMLEFNIPRSNFFAETRQMHYERLTGSGHLAIGSGKVENAEDELSENEDESSEESDGSEESDEEDFE